MKTKMTPGYLVFYIGICLAFGLFALLCVFPLYYIFINTISDNALSASGQVLFYPIGVHFDNYIKVFELKAIFPALRVSVLRTVLGTLSSVLCSAFVAYCVSKRELMFRKFVYRFFIITMYFGAGLIATYIVYRNLGLTNTFLIYIVKVVVNPFNLILIKTYIESIPSSLEESAEIDGAGYLTIFVKLMLPLCLPILATVAVFTAVDHWSNFTDTLIYIRDSKLYTLQFLLWQYLNEATALASTIRSKMAIGGVVDMSRQFTAQSVKMTITMIVVLPMLAIYPFFQRYFVKGIMLGAVKG